MASAAEISLSLSEVPPRVRAGHPGLQAARLAVAEARGRGQGAGRLSNPDVAFEYQSESQVSPRAAQLSIDQAFPLTRRLSLEKKQSAQLVTAAEWEVLDAERLLITEAQSLSVRILSLNQQRTLHQQQIALATKLSAFAEGRARAGELSPLDATQARVDANRFRIQAHKLENESVLLTADLKTMLGLTPADVLILRGNLPAPTLPAEVEEVHHRADLQLAQAKVATAETETELSQARRWQDVTAGVFAASERQETGPGTAERTGFGGFRVAVPLPLWDQNKGEIAEKTASLERARQERDALHLRIRNEAAAAREEMIALAGLAKETQGELLPLIQAQSNQLEKAYETGQTSLVNLLDARDQLLEVESAALEAVRDFHLARIRYESAIGLPTSQLNNQSLTSHPHEIDQP